MAPSLPTVMNEARRLVQSSRLGEATALLRARLTGAPVEPGAEPAEAARPSAPSGAAFRSRPRFPGPEAVASGVGRHRAAPDMPSGAQFLHLDHAGPAGRRAYRLYVPAARTAAPRPLVVMLHGCTQNPEDFAAGTRMNQLAQEMGFLVAYPEQPRVANASLCWNWFDPAHQRRGAGEPAILAGIVADICRSHAVDRRRVFAAGLSAGGAMAAVLGATYPDLFAAVGIHSGLPHGAADSVAAALSVMRSGRSVTGGAARGARAIVFHGAGDRTVHPANGDALAGLGLAAEARATVESGTTGGRAYMRTVLAAAGEAPAVEHWRVEGLGHAWSGGDAAGSYADPAGPDASREMLRFFLETPAA